MKAVAIAASVVLGMLAAPPARACRVNAPADERIARSGFDTVVLGTVEHADYTGERGSDWHPWKGTVRVERTLRGDTEARRLVIGRTGSTAACDDGVEPPKPGDAWIVYLRHENGAASVVLAYPFSIALSADPTLRGDAGLGSLGR